jgi:hypothetical protein
MTKPSPDCSEYHPFPQFYATRNGSIGQITRCGKRIRRRSFLRHKRSVSDAGIL